MRNWIRWRSPKILMKIPGNYIRRELARWPLAREPDHCQTYLIALPWYSWLVDVGTEKDTAVSWVLTRLSFAFSSAPGITSLDDSSHCQRNSAPTMKGALFSKIRMAQNAYEWLLIQNRTLITQSNCNQEKNKICRSMNTRVFVYGPSCWNKIFTTNSIFMKINK